MSSNKTSNYQLHLWEPQDDFLREEFNENSTKTDAAIKAVEVAGIKATVGGYTGSGATTRTFSFPFQPKLVVVSANISEFDTIMLVRGQTMGRKTDTSGGQFTAAWNGNLLTLTAKTFNDPGAACNYSGIGYFYCAIG